MEMKNLMDKSAIIKLREEGYSNRKIAKMLKINRKTVNKYWNEYKSNLAKLNNANLTNVKVMNATPPFAYENSFSNYDIPLFVKS